MSAARSRGSARNRISPRSADPGKRTALACVRCKGRKTKCSGEQPKCYTCRQGNFECVYLEHLKKVAVPECYLRDLEERVKQLESARSSSSQTERTDGSPDEDQEPDPEGLGESPLVNDMTQLVITPSGQKHYLGSSSSTSLGMMLRDYVEGYTPYDSDLNIEIQHPTYNPAAWPKRRPSVANPIDPPPYHVAKWLYKQQYMYIGTIFAFANPQTFEQRMQRLYAGLLDLSDREDCLVYCEVLLILAFGQMYSANSWIGHAGPPGFELFIQALQHLPDIHEEGSVLFVEVLSLISYYMQNLNRRDAAFLYVSETTAAVDLILTRHRLDWHCAWLFHWHYTRRYLIQTSMRWSESIAVGFGGLFIQWIGMAGYWLRNNNADCAAEYCAPNQEIQFQ